MGDTQHSPLASERRGRIGAFAVASERVKTSAHARAVNLRAAHAPPGAIADRARVANLVAAHHAGADAAHHLAFAAMIHARAVALAAPHRTLAPLAPRHFSTLLAPSKTLHDGLFGNFEVAVQFGVRAEVHRRANDDGDEGAEHVSGEPNDRRERLGPAPFAKRRTELLAHRLLQREVGVLGAVHRRLLGGHQQGLDAVPDHVPEEEDEDDDGTHDGPGEEADVDEEPPGDHPRGGDLLPRHVELELGDGTDGEVLRDGFGGVDGVVDAALGEPAGALGGVDGRAARGGG